MNLTQVMSRTIGVSAGASAGVFANKFLPENPVIGAAIKIGAGAFLPELLPAKGKAKSAMKEHLTNFGSGLSAQGAGELFASMTGINGVGCPSGVGSYVIDEDYDEVGNPDNENHAVGNPDPYDEY